MDIKAQLQEVEDTEVDDFVWQGVKFQLHGMSVAEVGRLVKEQRSIAAAVKKAEDAGAEYEGVDPTAYGVVRWLIGGVYDPDTGERAFTLDDLDMLAEKLPAKIAQQMAIKVQKLSGQAEEDLEGAVTKFIDLTDGAGSVDDIRTAYQDMRRIARGDNKAGVLGEGPDGSSETATIEPSSASPVN